MSSYFLVASSMIFRSLYYLTQECKGGRQVLISSGSIYAHWHIWV